jgi:dihydroorotate dehydrogenase (fumarate)
MANLQTTYLGLNLKNPIIVSSSGLTSNVDSIKKLEENGAAAIVLKSLFEEQILHEAGSLLINSDYPEAEDYLRSYVTSNNVEQYLNLISKAKEAVSIPIIASINCITATNWLDFAKKIQDAGADALEVNVFVLPTDTRKKSEDYEETYFALAEKLRKLISIPIVFKLGDHFTNPLRVIEQLWYRNIQGVVLFNRFFAPDIDINKLKVVSAEVFSNPSDIRNSLRWVAIANHQVPKIDISSSTGVHDGEGVVKMLLAGASSVQVCSTLYKNGFDSINKMIIFIETWMNEKGYKTITDFKGIMNYGKIGDPDVYERSQFMKFFSSHE